MWESTFVGTCAFLGDGVEQAEAHLAPSSASTRTATARVLGSSSKLERARLLATEIDAVKRALDAMEAPWR